MKTIQELQEGIKQGREVMITAKATELGYTQELFKLTPVEVLEGLAGVHLKRKEIKPFIEVAEFVKGGEIKIYTIEKAL